MRLTRQQAVEPLQTALTWYRRDREYTGEIESWICETEPRTARVASQMVRKGASADAEQLDSFSSAYLLWHHQPDFSGITVAERYFAEFPDRFHGREDWYHAQKRSWLGLWSMQVVDGGRGMRMVDRLTGEQRYVFEFCGNSCQATRFSEPRDTILGRVVDIDDQVSVLGGAEPIPLPPHPAAAVHDAFMRELFPSRKRLEPAQLRDDVLFMMLKDKWHYAIHLWINAFGTDAAGRLRDLSPAQGNSPAGRELLRMLGDLLLDAETPVALPGPLMRRT